MTHEHEDQIMPSLERLARLARAGEHGGGLNPAQWEALRYLSRANRFSNSPGALTRYLGATKGTISQTVMSLERKGYVSKAERAGERRSVSLVLTARGHEALASNSWTRLAAAAENLGPKTRRRLAKGLRELLATELSHGNHDSFGQCHSCRFFREDQKGRGPHHCMYFDEPLGEPEINLICIAHQDR